MANLQTSTVHPSVDTPSTSGDYKGYYYDVFISHRGPDLKNTFASHAYHRLLSHGLRPFFDREELREGEFLSPQIEGAIRTASVHIAIFSPRYAESKWCLDELVLICNSGAAIIPVFYNVKPSELRWTGRYVEALSIHEQKGRYDPGTLKDWRKALEDVSSISGFELDAYNGDEGKLLEDLVQCVLKKRRKAGLYVATYPTGLDEKVEDFGKTLSLQELQTGKVKVMGIVGMGGLGKTTLAKELFNKKSSDFGKSCFLSDVRENADRRSLSSLQAQLIEDLTQVKMQITHVDQGKEMLKTHVSTSLHALIVIDDVNHTDQLNAFLPIKEVLRSDSLILVTSRDKDVLTSSGIVESSIYKLTGLNEQHSKELFCSHAFCQSHPPLEFKDIVAEFCRACDGLPLSLKVIGSLLCGKTDRSYWEGILDKLRQMKLPNEIQQTLKLSYDALDGDEKQIFLDIACYFVGENRDMAIRIWDGSGWNGLVGLANLQAKCLVEVNRENTIQMHDHVRDLGRQIADQQKSSGVISHRLWRLIEDIPDLLQQSSVITEVRGIRTVPRLLRYSELPELPESEGASWLKSWCGEVLGNCLRRLINPSTYRFSKLQLAATEDDDLESILKRVKSPNLIWLRWNNCPYTSLPPWILMNNTRVLELCAKKLNTLWRTESQAPLELRQLTIYSPLLKFPKSIGKLKYIEKIVVKHSNLKSLPEEFCDLTSLKYLDLSESGLLQVLPNSFGCLTNLQHLDLSRTSSLQMLPNSFGYLTKLQHLDLSFSSSLLLLPDDFGNLKCLKHLDLQDCCNLAMTNETFANICSLEYLNLSKCIGVAVLPPQVAHQQSLEELYLLHTNLQELPGDIGNLGSLRVLRVGSPCLKKLPCSLGQLSSLKDFWLYKCEEMKSLPDSLGLLTELSMLSLQFCGIESLPPEVVKLNKLEKLAVNFCPMRELPFKKGVEGESATVELSQLEYLHLMRTNISEISFVEGVCPSLKYLGIVNCDELVEVGALPPTLITLSFKCCTTLRKMEGLCNLTNLQELDISACFEVEELPCLDRLTSLKKIMADCCLKLKRIRGVDQLTQLQELSVSRCFALVELARVEDLVLLEKLNIALCPKLQWSRGVLEQLRQRLREGLVLEQ